MSKEFRTSVGGQALMEGIMMRGPEKICCAVRKPDGTIETKIDPVKNHGIWTKIPLLMFFKNSFKLAIIITVLQVLTSSFAAYPFAKMKFPGKDIIFLGYIATIAVPWQVYMVPQFIMIRKMQLADTHLSLILMQAFTAFGVFLMRQSYLSVPNELSEAARIDGLSEVRIFFQMFIPTMKSTYAAAAVITFMNAWNSYLWPKVIMTDNKAMTMPMLIANLITGYVTDYGMLMCGVLFCSIPTMIVFFVLQKQFAEGITGAVK